MSNFSTSWKRVLELRSRNQAIRLELARIDRFLNNPFANNLKSAEERKKYWEKAVKKKKELKKEYSDANKEIAKLVEENEQRIKERKGKK